MIHLTVKKTQKLFLFGWILLSNCGRVVCMTLSACYVFLASFCAPWQWALTLIFSTFNIKSFKHFHIVQISQRLNLFFTCPHWNDIFFSIGWYQTKRSHQFLIICYYAITHILTKKWDLIFFLNGYIYKLMWREDKEEN
jgi:hypothetical protein